MKEKYKNIKLLFKQLIAINSRILKQNNNYYGAGKNGIYALCYDKCINTLTHSLEDTTIFVTKELVGEIEELINDCHEICKICNCFQDDFMRYNNINFKQAFFEQKKVKYIFDNCITIKSFDASYLYFLLDCITYSFPWASSLQGFEHYSKLNVCFQNIMRNIFRKVLEEK